MLPTHASIPLLAIAFLKTMDEQKTPEFCRMLMNILKQISWVLLQQLFPFFPLPSPPLFSFLFLSLSLSPFLCLPFLFKKRDGARLFPTYAHMSPIFSENLGSRFSIFFLGAEELQSAFFFLLFLTCGN